MSGFNMDLNISPPVRIFIAVCLAVLVIVAIALPANKARKRVDSAIEAARREYVDTGAMVERYKALKASAGSKQSVLLEEPLFSYVDKVTRGLKLTRRIDYVRPENRTADDGTVTEVVHVAFKGITLDEFVRFLYRIEVQKREIFVKNISIKKDAKKNLITQMTLQKRS